MADIKQIKAARLREAREKARYESATAAATAFGWTIPTYISHENATRGLGPDAAARYAKAFKVGAAWLLALDNDAAPAAAPSVSSVTTQPLTVTGVVAAGVWREAWERDEDDRFTIPVGANPFPRARRFGLVVEGRSMDLVYEPGTILDCISIFDVSIDPAPGDHVIVERIRSDGLRELTVKQFGLDDDNRAILLACSSRPEFQSPIEVGQPDHDHNGDDCIQVIAFVIGSYSPRAIALMQRASAGRGT